MYTVSSKLKTFSLALIIIGALGIAYGFFTGPKTVEDVKEMLHSAEDSHGASADTKVPLCPSERTKPSFCNLSNDF